jgi:hypothetical protein
VAFAVFCAAFGVRFALVNLFFPDLVADPASLPGVASDVAFVVAAASLVLVAREFPRPLGPGEARLAAMPLAAGLAYAVATTFDEVSRLPAAVAAGDLLAAHVPAMAFEALAANLVYGALWGFQILNALRFRRADAAGRRQHALTGAALLVFLGYLAGVRAVTADFAPVHATGTVALLALVALLWLRNLDLPDPHLARGVAWLALGSMLVGMVATWLIPGTSDVFLGLTRTAGVLLLGYAILRHQLLGIDVRVRWTLSRGTVAAAFIGVFFVASESAQAFFAESAQSEWLGIGAAGLLVFAIAPLQRAAERLANVAVPAGAPAAGPANRREQAYRDGLRLALRDRRLTPREELVLADLAEQLGLGARRALEIRQEVEAGLADAEAA